MPKPRVVAAGAPWFMTLFGRDSLITSWMALLIDPDLALAISGNEAVQFTPILLLGEPGLGKTYFAKKLAHALGTGFEFVSMSSLTAGWVLTGASAQWHNARPGKVAQTLIEGEYANPVVVLDEVDKTGGDSRYDPMGALYSLLERDTASHFKDEFIDVDMDASHILWIATANDESVIPEPILNRMNVYPIERPDAEGSRRIAVAVYREILDAHHWPFPADPPDAVIERLAAVPPRDMRKLLLDAFGTARLANRDYLIEADIDAKKLCGRRPSKTRSPYAKSCSTHVPVRAAHSTVSANTPSGTHAAIGFDG